MDEMNPHTIDVGPELWQAVQSCFRRSPVISIGPIVAQVLHIGEGHPLRLVTYGLSLGANGCA